MKRKVKGKIKAIKNKSNKNKNIKNYKYNKKRKRLIIKDSLSLHPKIEFLENLIKKYQEPNEYTRQDQDQKIDKYMKIPPVEFIKKE